MPSISVPLVAAGVGAAGSIGGALIGSNAAQSAANTQANSARTALNTQVDAENTALAAQAPYNTIGTGAIDQLANLYGIAYGPSGSATSTTSPTGVITPGNVNAATSSAGGQSVENAAMANFTNTPDYQFAFQQGMQALDRSAAASGTLQSGGQSMAAQQYGQGLASQQFGNYFNRLLSLSQIGQGAASGTATNALNAGNSQGNTQQAIGQAQASGTVGSANALTSGLNGIGSSLTSSLLLSQLGGGGNALSAYNNGTANYMGTSNAQQDAMDDAGLLPN